jgi:hypothetical protein
MTLESQQYPIGKWQMNDDYSNIEIEEMISQIETFPMRLEYEVQSLLEFQLNTPYREDGWTINQVIHHCADSHLNAVLRIKLALSLTNPTITPYPEDVWATMNDYDLPFNNSTTLLFCVHKKLSCIIKNLNETDLNKTYYHPEYKKTFRVKDVISLYAWHGNHHLGHVKLGIERAKILHG